MQILKHKIIFMVIHLRPIQINIKSFPRSAFASIETLSAVAIIDSKRSIIIHIQLICDVNHTVDIILINIIRKLHNIIGIEGT